MRFVLAMVAVLVGMSVTGMAQSQPNQFKVKSSKADAEPKSTATVKAPGGTSSSTTSKELRSVERGAPKTAGAAHPAKAPKAAAMKSGKDDKNPPMNFGGKGSGGGAGGKTPSPYKGRLKQKGQGGHN